MLKKLFLVVSKFAEETNGILVKNMGDAFLLAFDNMDDCLKFVEKMLRYTVVNKLSLGRNNSDLVRFRTGIFQGDVYKLKYRLQNKKLFDYFGNTVNTAARLEGNVSPEGGFEGAGRPKEVSKYGKDGSARGREPLGRPKIPIALAHYDALKKSFGSKASEILNETLESDKINEEYKEFKEEK